MSKQTLLPIFLVASMVYSINTEDDVSIICRNPKEGIIDCNNLGLEMQLKGLGKTTTMVTYDYNQLRKIRVFELCPSLSKLTFRHNLIASIEERAFENLENLFYLDISHNLLPSESLRPVMFKGPNRYNSVGNIKVLDLSSNILHTLHQDLFEFLPDLEELYLASNPFKMLDHATLVALSSIHKIQVLDLSSTQLSDVPPRWLNALINLKKLDLSSNRLECVPASLEEARGLRHLVLNYNPIKILSNVPRLETVQILELNWMMNLTSIEAHSLVNLTNVKELYISNNHYLVHISEDALVEPGSYESNITEGAIFPPVEKLDLSDNRLAYLEEELIHWDKLKELKLESNPWVCDCNNQWMLNMLIPLMNEKNLGFPSSMICGAPSEMKSKSMLELAMRQYKMRCLDYYGNEPDKDAKVLIIVLIVVLTAIPISLLFLHLVKRPRGNNGYPTAYYRRAHEFETIN